MRKAASFCAALGVALILAAPTQAAYHHMKIRHHHVAVVKSNPSALHRVCDWIGPGGRAVYRCTTVDAPQASLVPAGEPSHPHCDWIGPGGRALYLCR
jgi:hypothetical protein